jgi:hypothetical protein
MVVGVHGGVRAVHCLRCILGSERAAVLHAYMDNLCCGAVSVRSCAMPCQCRTSCSVQARLPARAAANAAARRIA